MSKFSAVFTGKEVSGAYEIYTSLQKFTDHPLYLVHPLSSSRAKLEVGWHRICEDWGWIGCWLQSPSSRVRADATTTTWSTDFTTDTPFCSWSSLPSSSAPTSMSARRSTAGLPHTLLTTISDIPTGSVRLSTCDTLLTTTIDAATSCETQHQQIIIMILNSSFEKQPSNLDETRHKCINSEKKF